MTETFTPEVSSTPLARGRQKPIHNILATHGIEFARDFLQFAGRKIAFAALFVFLAALLEGVGLAMLVPILSLVTETGTHTGGPLATMTALFDRIGLHTKTERLVLLLLIFALLLTLRAVAISIRDVTLVRLQIGFVSSSRERIAQKIAAARWGIIVRLRHARVMQVMNADIMQIGAGARFLVQSAVSMVMLLSQCALAFLLSPTLALFAYGMLLIAALTMGPALRRAHALGSFAMSASIEMTNSTAQFLGGLKLAVSQNLQARYVSEVTATLESLKTQQVAFTRKQTNRHLFLTTAFALIGAVVVLFGIAVLDVRPAILMTMMLILSRITGPALLIQQGAQQFTQALPAYAQIKELERELVPAPANGDADGVPIPEGPIVLRNVRFRHGDDNTTFVLDNASLTLAPGAFIGIVGESGTGKTTFADLLVGLLEPQTGDISVGGTALTPATLKAWRNEVSYVSQDPFLFHDTVRRNLTWVKPDAREDELWNVLNLAGAEEIVRRMESGLDTVVGERGTLISGGERQRIALARALLREPRLLILDEATNAIDVAGEREILSRLAARTPRPTIVMIAHRSESLQLCERILTLSGGTFVERSIAEIAPST